MHEEELSHGGFDRDGMSVTCVFEPFGTVSGHCLASNLVRDWKQGLKREVPSWMTTRGLYGCGVAGVQVQQIAIGPTKLSGAVAGTALV